MELPNGVALMPGEDQRIAEALAAIEKDSHSARTLNVQLRLHINSEYPKLLYKGTGAKDNHISVADVAAEDAARNEGYGNYQPEVE